MSKIVVHGGYSLSGEICVGGAKNSAVALIPASILCGEEVLLKNVPNISDIGALEDILTSLGCEVSRGDHSLKIVVVW